MNFNQWLIVSWSIPYQDKRYALYWFDQDWRKRDFAHRIDGRVRNFGTRSGARGVRHRLTKTTAS